MALEPLPGVTVDRVVVRRDVERTAHGVAGQAGGDGVAGDAVDEQEPTGVAAHVVLVQRQRGVGGQLHTTDVVHLEQPGGIVVAGDDIQLVAHRSDCRGNDLGTHVQQVRPAVGQRLLAGPHQVGGEPVGRLGLPLSGGTQEVTAGDVHLAVQGDGHRLAHSGGFDVTVGAHDAVDRCGLAGVGHRDHVARTHDARGDRAAVPAEVALGARDQLDLQPERQVLDLGGRLPRDQGIHHGSAVVPLHDLAVGLDHVGTGDGADGDRGDLVDAQSGGCGANTAGELFERRMLVADEVHLVDGHHDALDAHQGAHGEVAVSLRSQAAGGIDEQDRQVGGRGSHRHVAGVLLVPGGVGDDDATSAGQIQVAVGHVDGDALLAFGLEAVGQQGVVDLAHGDRGPAAAGGAGVLELVDRHGVGLDQQTPDQGGLAVVDGAARDHTQHSGAHVVGPVQRVGLGDESRSHQKYPSAFLASMDELPSPSIRRPERSDILASPISLMRESMSAASDSTAPVSG